MKYLINILSFLLFHFNGFSQAPATLKLRYEITNKTFHTDDKGISRMISQQKMMGYFTKKENRFFFFATPLDTGLTVNNNSGPNQFFQSIYMKDSLQLVHYRDVDTGFNLVSIPRGNARILNRFPIVWGFQQWKVLPETKKIGSFLCQKAVWRDDGELVAEIWFSPDVPVFFALNQFNEVPGLVVEATLFYPHIEFKLIEYQANVAVSEDEILPSYMRGKATVFTTEDYLRSQQRLRNLRKTQGRIN